MRASSTLLTLALLGAAAPLPAAPTSAPDQPILHLSAEATRRVSVDEMTVVLASERSGETPGKLNAQVLAELDGALDKARQTPGVSARLGNVRTQQAPRGRPGPWQVRGEIVLEARDFSALGELAGQLAQRLQIASVSFALSAGKRREIEQQLLDEAAAAFRARARAAALAFGFDNYRLGEITLATSGNNPGPLRMRMEASVQAAIPVPGEGGEAEVQLRVDGSVVLLGERQPGPGARKIE